MIFLRSIERLGDVEAGSGFPFDLPPVRGFRKLELTSPVTFFVGENGTGKSTLLEAIGLRAKLPCAAGRPLDHDPALVPIHPLARSLRLVWAPQTKYGLFLRVEDFFHFARENREKSEPAAAVTVSVGPEVRAIPEKNRSGESAEYAGSGPSPGESFLDFVRTHCTAGGLHLIDEPEAALSPQRQLALMSVLKSLVEDNAQFIIATHSPILLAYPGAQVFSFDDGNIVPVQYSELPHVNFTREFLRDPERYLNDL
ncbi:ATPase [Opitutaceae bacterium EW11]|nr:ATPase [Opitutaceae bacterium EW11]